MKRVVLVIDDSADIRALIAVGLRRRGYEVALAAGALEGLAYLTGGGAADLIILDMRMPDVDGFGFLARQSSCPSLATRPVLVYTAESGVAATVFKCQTVVGLVSKTSPLSDMFTAVASFLTPSAEAASG